MDKIEELKEIEQIFQQLSIEVKYRKGYFKGGLCKINGKPIVFVNRTHPVEKQIEILLEELGRFELDDLNISPQISVLLDKN